MKSDFDGDVKIYQKKSNTETKEFDGLAKDIDYHKANGNVQKAVELGVKLAQIKPELIGQNAFGLESRATSGIVYQARVMITFLCGRVTRETVDIQILNDLIRNSMYNYLKENENGYYKNIADGAAFSFYRLALKKPANKDLEMGKEFAKMCGAKSDNALIDIGTKLYLTTISYVKELISQVDFK